MQFKSQSLHLISRQIKHTFKSQILLLPIRQITTQQQQDRLNTDNEALKIQNLLKAQTPISPQAIATALNQCNLSLTQDLVLDVLRRHRSDWKPAFFFFNYASRSPIGCGYSPGTLEYNEILDILGKMKRFEELAQVFDEMSKRKGLINERTYAVLVHRFASAHKIEEATELFYKRGELGLEVDVVGFRVLLMSLCRHKHVQAAEFLLHSKKGEFDLDIRTMNVVLNGWCVLGSLREAKRFWNDIVRSRCRPDKYTYGIFINSLCKAGKLSTAVKLFRAMWEKGCDPDVAICNCVIDGLCFKKRIPEALAIFEEMNDRDCLPDVATYNSLIKHLCKISRMEKVFELLGDMERKAGGCAPNARTYCYLLRSTKKPEEVNGVLERMERNGCKMTSDTLNLLLRLFMEWGCEERVEATWVDMERSGLGPDQRSYTVMVHGLFDKGKLEEALHYFDQMTLKGMVPEPRTKLLVKAINIKLKIRESGLGGMEAKDRDDPNIVLPHKGGKKSRKSGY